MKISHLTTLGFVAMMAVATPATAQVEGAIALINDSSTQMCAVYFTTPDADFADSPELLSANNLSCIQPGEVASIWYEGLSGCYAVVEIFDDVADPLYSNGFELCNRGFIAITDGDVITDEDSDAPLPEIRIEEGGGHIGYLEIINTSKQQLCLAYFQSLQDQGEPKIYQLGENGNCIAPNWGYFLEYSLPVTECRVRVSIESGFLDVLFDQVYDLCEQTDVLVSD